MDNEVWGLFFFSFGLDKANLVHFEKKLKTGFSASNSSKVQASREYNVKDKTLPTTLRKFYPRVAKAAQALPGAFGSLGGAVCPSDERGYIFFLLIGILEQAVPLLSLFMGFACSFPPWDMDLISGEDVLYCHYVRLAKQSCAYGLHFRLN